MKILLVILLFINIGCILGICRAGEKEGICKYDDQY